MMSMKITKENSYQKLSKRSKTMIEPIRPESTKS